MDETEPTTTTEPNHESDPEAKPKPKQRRGFAAMNPDAHRELARAGGIAAHATGLAHSFTSEQARDAGKKGGAMTASNREHMAEIGRKGGFARKGYRREQSQTVANVETEAGS